ncbi:PAN/Apple domain [Dillenia turbinata]|uniref:non-specific serine/threonine protein kinase n=1 Tax=Dillenia turbinata TaxID=194707 RepID=A0AAN8VMP0_9MAGN
MRLVGGISLAVLVHTLFYCCAARDTITFSQVIRDHETIASGNGTYRLGFFSLDNSSNRYVGIWYNISETTIVWVANRDKPVEDSSGVFTVSEDGNLQVLNGQGEILWSSNVSNINGNTSAQLLDTGDIVLTEVSTGRYLWESFQDPSNKFLPSMKLTANLQTNEKLLITSWKSNSDPARGSFSGGLDPLSISQFFIWNNSQPYWRSGPWNGNIFVGIYDMYSVVTDGFSVITDQGTAYISYNYADKSYLTNLILYYNGTFVQRKWNYGEKNWEDIWLAQKTECDVYGKCGPFGSCYPQNSPLCSCMRGFEPRHLEEWSRGNWSGGCVRKTPLQCDRNDVKKGKEDGFFWLSTVKIPDSERWSASNEDACRSECLNNCSCVAYGYYSGIGCLSWSGDLIDIQKFPKNGEDIYIRVAYSELAMKSKEVLFPYRKDAFLTTPSDNSFEQSMNHVQLQGLSIFKLDMLATATNNFDEANKLGQGGFGDVYRGVVPNGQVIAVKRLSRASTQGIDEFINEVVVISKLQHRNLVRLLDLPEAVQSNVLLILPTCLDPKTRDCLDWRKRFSVIEGIGRGLLYLHRDSRLKIIHRDLKASNILLDEDLNPKISDFGMARIFGGNEDQANTRRVVGTYGYMSPEYAMEGRFSEKSDVFSFGVLLLEIVSGRKNTGFYNEDEAPSLLAFAWKLWIEGNAIMLADLTLSSSLVETEVLRCIHVGLLCVQEFAKDRPTVYALLSMLTSEVTYLPDPKQPGFVERQIRVDAESSQDVITQTQNLFEGETLVSSNEIFELGFFRPNGSTNQYIGIWYKNVSERKIVWVANRDNPVAVSNFSASLSIGEDGNLKILDGKQRIIWSTHVDIGIRKTVALLLDNGNFVLKDNDSGVRLWESFNFPGNTLIADMVLSVNSKTGERKSLTSWKSEDDPSLGEFTNALVPQMPPQCFVWKGLKPYWRSGEWNGVTFVGIQGSNPSYFEKFTLNYNDQDGVHSLSFYSFNDMSVIVVLESNGTLRRLTWDETAKKWSSSFESINTACDVYGTCGEFGFCDARKSPICSCLKGFGPRFKDEWNRGNWSGGCVRRTELGCAGNSSGGFPSEKEKKDGFLGLHSVKLPDFSLDLAFDNTMECEEWCLNNCSCLAYAYVAVLRCMVWTTNLIDTQQYLVPGGPDLFLRLASSELEDKQNTSTIIIISVISGFIIIGGLIYGFLRQQTLKQRVTKESIKVMKLDDTISERLTGISQGNQPELPQFMFNTIAVATENFSITNKLGEGGFGSVYKGKLIDEQEVAVKRLSNLSGQGVREFKNEIILISKLQHINLVKILGYCIEGDEKLLIYEYMPNKSLDTFLFGQLQNPSP